MPDNFPRDITIDILIKLPVSSILRFNCVCKSWRSLIEDRQFIKQHYDRYKNDTNFHKIFLACIKYQYHCQQYYSNDAPFQHDSGISLLEHPPKINHTLTREFVVSSCKYGLFLLAFSYDKIILWNPTIRESRTIPRAIQIEKERSYDLRYSSSLENDKIVYGLGYVSTLEDYKIVRVGPKVSQGGHNIQIFSTKNDSWKLMGKLPRDTYYDRAMVIADGIVYMISHKKGKKFILSLCLKNEKFEEILCPDEDLGIVSETLFTIGESLFLAKFLSPVNKMVDFEVWCMKKNGMSCSWNIMLTIIIPCIWNDRFWMQPVGFIRDGDMLFLRDKTEFVIYDSKRHFQKVKVVELEESLCLNWAVTYVETLISPNAI
ncbi:F-box/kelch-repeat protein At3g23880-like [Nicotiana tabacum]|uniref:F-box/kelch-repeat protein At3g23880-like n=1 Tax=Nicotiana tabacum TaxID=4097 RepID=A0A1S3YZ07_TOBAC|nr:PREDICTED: F-box/kelch-repeat protein At3g23880-like [Nicotiana tabacum]